MNSPKQEANLNGKVLCCCYLVQKVIELDSKSNSKKLDDIAHNQTTITNLDQPVIDTSAKSVENTLNDDGVMTRKVGNNPIIKSNKLPEDIKYIKRLQDINNKEKRESKRENGKDR